jgi:CRISPR-associated protein Csm3
MRKLGQRHIQGIIHCTSGLRIGGSDEDLSIGGADLTCIKQPGTGKPYIPGTSLKGKMRSELEKRLGKMNGSEPCGCGRNDCLVCRVFGPHKNVKHDLGPTRIIVRDAQLREGEGAHVPEPLFETKTENLIDRKIGTAMHPRRVERVNVGAEFVLKIGVQHWDIDKDCAYTSADSKRFQGPDALVEFVKDGLREIQDTGLGSGVSKGSGEIELRELLLDGVKFDLQAAP